ncbi:cysteine desulfurase [Candidatus Woesearchaeota archaeon]|nr:cysteine desulfurase [Candidatus Woesearchaeota archaeon]
MRSVYLDYAAATPVRKEVAVAMKPFISDIFANPSSVHAAGKRAHEAMEKARAIVQKILHVEKNSEIIFTGSGTESINLALKGVMRAYQNKGNHLITTKIEHKAVLETCAYLEKYGGCHVTYLDVDRFGRVNPRDVERAITSKTVLVSVMYANNEIGTVQPIMEIGKITKKHHILFHTDACQAAGALDINVKHLGVDLLTLNGSKMYGPKGTGILYVREGVHLVPLVHGGRQELGLRGGTENVPGIVGFAKALDLVERERGREVNRLCTLRDYFIKRIISGISGSTLNGDPTNRLPNNINVSFSGIDAEVLVKMLSAQGIYVSAGSACTANSVIVSHVLTALGVPNTFAMGTLRFTLGRSTTRSDLDAVLRTLKSNIKIIRKTGTYLVGRSSRGK